MKTLNCLKLLVISALCCLTSQAEPDLPKLGYVFASGSDGYHTFRIPSLIKTKKGTLIASCEGRKDHAGDSGNIDLVFKRSTDHGKTWSDLRILRDIKQTAGNPCPVIDQKSGRIIMVFCEMDHSEHHVIQGKSARRVFVTHSDDDGQNWSEPRNITASANPESRYRWMAAGPGIGIQIQQGKFSGRLVIPFANTTGHDYGVHTIYSDDRGLTWKASEPIRGGCNESQLVELSDGRLMLNMRMQQKGKGFRAISFSKDGGASWSELVHDDGLKDPVCQASLISYQAEGKRLLLFSNPAGKGRAGMTLRASADDGKSWPFRQLLYAGSSAYSCLAVTDDNHVICLFEGGPASYAKGGIAAIRLPLSSIKIRP